MLSTLKRSSLAPDAALDDDIHWLLCRGWNLGVGLHAQRRRTEALQLCSLAMQLLGQLTEKHRRTLSPRMTSSFALLTASRSVLTVGVGE